MIQVKHNHIHQPAESNNVHMKHTNKQTKAQFYQGPWIHENNIPRLITAIYNTCRTKTWSIPHASIAVPQSLTRYMLDSSSAHLNSKKTRSSPFYYFVRTFDCTTVGTIFFVPVAKHSNRNWISSITKTHGSRNKISKSWSKPKPRERPRNKKTTRQLSSASLKKKPIGKTNLWILQ